MKRVIALLILLPLLSGCWSRRELNDVALVIALGIDMVEPAIYEVTLAVAGPGAAGGGKEQQGNGSQPKTIVVSERGRSFAGILRQIELHLPRRVNLTHTLLVVVGERLAEHGLGDTLDFILRAPEVRLQGMIMMARGSVRTLLQTEPLMEALVSKSLTEIAQARVGLEMRLWEFFSALATDYRSPMLPVVELVESSDAAQLGQKYLAHLGGAAVLRGDRVALYLDAQEVRAITWLRGHGREGVITVPCGEEPGAEDVSFRITGASVRTRVTLQGKQPAYNVALHGRLRVSEMQCPRSLMQESVRAELLARAEQDLHDLTLRVIRKLQEAEVDPLFFGERIRALHPAVWHEVGVEKWGKTWRQSPVTVTVHLDLETSALMSDPLQARSGPEG
ncbi:Ger(x)C family spore germination protein [Symbiobacterium terraclitae]|uniref:Ger(x)C family spore germination protein n=1 Tax=Symbiobacterium terraclitae TaxID=557451 RepID=UPI0035B50373